MRYPVKLKQPTQKYAERIRIEMRHVRVLELVSILPRREPNTHFKGIGECLHTLDMISLPLKKSITEVRAQT